MADLQKVSNLKLKLASVLSKSLSLLYQKLSSKRITPWSNENFAIYIEVIREEKFGDYACTLSMDKELRQHFVEIDKAYENPKKFAIEICASIEEHLASSSNVNKNLIKKIEIAGPGFINFHIDERAFVEVLVELQNNSLEDIIKGTRKNPKKKIIFEYISANPTGPLNVVSARSAVLGDACCRLLDCLQEEKVFREYYVNDYGNQIDLLGKSCFLRYLELENCKLRFGEEKTTIGFPFPTEAYHGMYIIEVVKKLMKEKKSFFISMNEIEKLRKLSQKENANIDFLEEEKYQKLCVELGKLACSFLLEEQKKTLKKFGIHFDNYFRESTLHQKNSLESVKKSLEKYTYKEKDTTFFKSSHYRDEKDRVIVRSNGKATYFLADLAYHKDKIERGFDTIYNIWGPDHHGYIARLSAGMQALGFSGDFHVIIAQQVNLLRDGLSVKMSKRSGQLVSLKKLLEEIPSSVLRYFFLMRSSDSPINFDLTLATDTSEKNPYYYVAYAHARICSIFTKLEEIKKEKVYTKSTLEEKFLKNKEIKWVWTKERRKLVFYLVHFPEVVIQAGENLSPHTLLAYLYSLASFFSQFYGAKENRVIEQEGETIEILLSILEVTAFCLQKGLNLLGMEAPKRMFRE